MGDCQLICTKFCNYHTIKPLLNGVFSVYSINCNEMITFTYSLMSVPQSIDAGKFFIDLIVSTFQFLMALKLFFCEYYEVLTNLVSH